MSDAQPIATVDAVTMRFGTTTALDAVTTTFPPGITGLIGANGAGKSTLFKLLLGLLRPTSGELTVLGQHPVSDARELRSRIGYAPERNVLPDDLAAGEFVRHMAEVRGLPRGEARSRSSDTLWLVGLGEERARPLGSMSTGQRQRVKLAQALAADPSLVLLDEPTDGLDPMQREQMLELVASVHQEFGIHVVITSHVLDEIERVCDSVVVLDAGRHAVSGAVRDLAGGTNGLTLELVDTGAMEDPIAAVAALAEARGAAVTRVGSILSLTLAESTDTDDLRLLADIARDAVADVGARIRRLGPKRLTLEDVLVGDGEASSANGYFGSAP